MSNFPSGVVLAGNSTTTPLNAGATFTGAAVDVSAFASVVIAVKTDQNGSCWGEFSADGTNWDSAIISSITAGVNDVHRYTVTRRYFRVVFTNTSASNQTYIRLQSMVGLQTALTSALNTAVQRDQDTLVVRPLDFNLMVAESLYQNVSNTIKDGINSDIDTGTVPEDIINQGGTYSGFPAAPVAGQIVTASAESGTVYYSYMATDTDTDYTFATKDVTGAAGTFALGHNIWRCNFAHFVSTSSTSFNSGNITVRGTGGANVFVVIEAGYSQSFCSAYTVPYQSAIYLDRVNGNMRGSATGSLDGFFWYRAYGESPRLRFPFELQYGGLYFDDVDYLTKIPARTDIVPRITTSSTSNLQAKISYRFVKVKE